jgi:ABC-type lipoprotein export system ATPase subunit
MGKTLLLATHDTTVVQRADRVIILQDGVVVHTARSRS